MSNLVVVVAGVPSETGDFFTSAVKRLDARKRYPLDIVWEPLNLHREYNDEYVTRLYNKLARKLDRDPFSKDRNRFLGSTNLVVAYVDKGDGREVELHNQFGYEALVIPLQIRDFFESALRTARQKRRLVNLVRQELVDSIERSMELLQIIGDEVRSNQNSTCLLLPPKNFGPQFRRVRSLVQNASLNLYNQNNLKIFKANLQKEKRALRGPQGSYTGHRGQLFRASSRHNQHGIAPLLREGAHKISCVLRGRLRFGSPYDPRFHYDCPISRRANRLFISCHDDEVSVPSKRSHVNIAPNDNVRI